MPAQPLLEKRIRDERREGPKTDSTPVWTSTPAPPGHPGLENVRATIFLGGPGAVFSLFSPAGSFLPRLPVECPERTERSGRRTLTGSGREDIAMKTVPARRGRRSPFAIEILEDRATPASFGVPWGDPG